MCWHLPIFTARRRTTIVGTTELNFCVRYGNRWTLSVIDTNCFFNNVCYYTPLFPKCQDLFSRPSASAVSGSVTLHSVRLLRSRFGKTSGKRRVITREHEVKLLTAFVARIGSRDTRADWLPRHAGGRVDFFKYCVILVDTFERSGNVGSFGKELFYGERRNDE